MLELILAVAAKETLSRSETPDIIPSGSNSSRPVSGHDDSSSKGGGKQIPLQELPKIHDATRREPSGLPCYSAKREKIPPMSPQEILDFIDNVARLTKEAEALEATVHSPSDALLSGSCSPSSLQGIFSEPGSSVGSRTASSQSEASFKLPQAENVDSLSPVRIKDEPVDGILSSDGGCATTPPTSSIANLQTSGRECELSRQRYWEIAVSPSGFTVPEPLNSRPIQKSSAMTTDGYSRHDDTLKRSRAEDDGNSEEGETPAPSPNKQRFSSYSEVNSAATSEPCSTSSNCKTSSSSVNSPVHSSSKRKGDEGKIRDQRSRKKPRTSSSNPSDSGFEDGDDLRARRHPCRIRSKVRDRDADLIGHTIINLVHMTKCGVCGEVIEPRRDASKSHEKDSFVKSKEDKDSSD